MTKEKPNDLAPSLNIAPSSTPLPPSSPLPSDPSLALHTPKPVTTTSVSESGFPALGGEVKLSKAQKRRLGDGWQRKGEAPVFKDAYHAQLREAHGANVRAAEALEEEEEDMKGRRRIRALDPDTVNSLVEDVIREIAAEGELVTREKVRRNAQTN